MVFTSGNNILGLLLDVESWGAKGLEVVEKKKVRFSLNQGKRRLFGTPLYPGFDVVLDKAGLPIVKRCDVKKAYPVAFWEAVADGGVDSLKTGVKLDRAFVERVQASIDLIEISPQKPVKGENRQSCMRLLYIYLKDILVQRGEWDLAVENVEEQ
jgi:hypothetical protein